MYIIIPRTDPEKQVSAAVVYGLELLHTSDRRCGSYVLLAPGHIYVTFPADNVRCILHRLGTEIDHALMKAVFHTLQSI